MKREKKERIVPSKKVLKKARKGDEELEKQVKKLMAKVNVSVGKTV